MSSFRVHGEVRLRHTSAVLALVAATIAWLLPFHYPTPASAAAWPVVSGGYSLETVAYDGFDYPQGTALTGASGGVGWTAGWGEPIVLMGAPSPLTTGASGLTYPGLTVTGRSATFWGVRAISANSRDLPSVDSGVAYVQFLVNLAGGGFFSNGVPNLRLRDNGGAGQTGAIGWNNPVGDPKNASILDASLNLVLGNSGVAMDTGATTLLVTRIDYDASMTSLWVNPDLTTFDYASPPPANTTAAGFAPSLNNVWFGNRQGSFDEIRIMRLVSPDPPAPPPPPPPAISPSAQVLSGVVGVSVAPTSTFALENFSLIPRFVMFPPLPAGLSLDPVTGVVSGTPTEVYPSRRHWITATAGGNAESAFSTLQLSVTAGVPSAPRDVTAAPGDASVVVSWRVPESDGGAPVTGYVATATPGGGSCETTELSCEVTGLINGTSYSIDVVAVNSSGAGPAGQGGSVTPRTVPSVPRDVTAVPGDASVVVSWEVPESDGGAPVTGYVATATPGGESCSTRGELMCTITGLTNGQTYSLDVTATNPAGTSPAGSGGPVTPRARAQVVTVTGAGSEPLPSSIVARQTLAVVVTVTNSRGEPVADERVEVTVSGDATLPDGTQLLEARTDDQGRVVVSVVAGDSGEFSVTATAAGITSTAGPIAITPTPSIAIMAAGREQQDRRRVFVDLWTEGIAAGSELQTWIVKGEGCLAEPGRVVVTEPDGSAEWSRRARAELTVWFTHGGVTSGSVTLPGPAASESAGRC